MGTSTSRSTDPERITTCLDAFPLHPGVPASQRVALWDCPAARDDGRDRFGGCLCDLGDNAGVGVPGEA